MLAMAAAYESRVKEFGPEVIDNVYGCDIVKEVNNTFSVSTPISYERDFNSSEDAKLYAKTWIDKRKFLTKK